MTTHDTGWLKSSYSTGSNDACVEVRLTATTARIRDSKNPHGDTIRVPLTRWTRFTTRLS